MKFFILTVLLVGCSTFTKQPEKPEKPVKRQSYKEKVSERIESCILKLVDSGISESLIYSYCSKTHRPNIKAQ